MAIIILALLASFIPSFLIFFWFRSRESFPDYKAVCGKVLVSGLLSVFPVTLASALLHITMNILLKGRVPELMLKAFYKFIVLAFAEELVKYLTGNKYIKANLNKVSWMDVAAFMTIVACGFNLSESVLYAVGSDVITVLVRGVTALHEFYGLIMGYYLGKRMHTGNRVWMIPAFGIPFFLHGLYDYSLTPELLAVNDNLVFLPFIAILLSWIIGIRVLLKLIRGKNNPMYTKPLFPDAQSSE